MGRLDFHRGAHPESPAEALVVSPPHVFERRELHLPDGAPETAAADELGLEKPIHCFRESAHPARRHAGLCESHRQALAACRAIRLCTSLDDIVQFWLDSTCRAGNRLIQGGAG